MIHHNSLLCTYLYRSSSARKCNLSLSKAVKLSLRSYKLHCQLPWMWFVLIFLYELAASDKQKWSCLVSAPEAQVVIVSSNNSDRICGCSQRLCETIDGTLQGVAGRVSSLSRLVTSLEHIHPKSWGLSWAKPSEAQVDVVETIFYLLKSCQRLTDKYQWSYRWVYYESKKWPVVVNESRLGADCM